MCIIDTEYRLSGHGLADQRIQGITVTLRRASIDNDDPIRNFNERNIDDVAAIVHVEVFGTAQYRPRSRCHLDCH